MPSSPARRRASGRTCSPISPPGGAVASTAPTAGARSTAFYRMYFHWPVIFSRGCPHPCEYCAVQTYYQRSFRTRPVDDVMADLRTIQRNGGNRVLFLDDNPVAHPEKAKELFRAMIPLKMKWASQSTINIARDPELLDLAARSGCVSLSIGLESINEESLAGVRKDFNQARRFREDIAKMRARGIQVIALIMVGLDGDTPETFSRTLQFLVDSKISFLKLFTPCPYPGTKYHADMEKAGRILDGNWARYDYGSPLIRPSGMTAEEMIDGFRYVYEGFYSVRNILRRFTPPPPGQLLESLAYIVANWKVNRYLRSHDRAWATIS
ncbi:MAG: radical SAM protein [Deltaproteobacteria bacterium]|nr:MAG: radical SAM protein [Deltaproteobacteria bacterium]